MFSSDFVQTQNQSQMTQQQNIGLTRYRSAPSSFFATPLDTDNNNSINEDEDEESEDMFSAFINGTPDLNQNNTQMQFVMKPEVEDEPVPRSGLMGFEVPAVGSYSLGIENVRGRNGNFSNLLRQISSPAEFLNGFNITGEIGNYKVQNNSEAGSSATGLGSNHMNFSSGPFPSSRFMPSIPETRNESINLNNGLVRNSSTNIREFDAFSHGSWNESSNLKRKRDDDTKMFSNFSGFENQNGETKKSSPGLVHHLSFPKFSSEMDFIKFQPESVPCQIRAKRGCATHPRSIAERVRRTKISNKMKKLQDLFPDMDKQANTSDMLDLAVGYIKDLQKKVQTLIDTRKGCICSSKHPHPRLAT